MNELAIIENHFKPLVPQFEALLRPTGVPAERIIRSCLISCERNPKLLECSPVSVIQAGTTGAVLGLEADGATGQGFLVPFNDRKKGLQAQWVTGYRGYNTIGARVGLTIDGEVVREGDDFDYMQGTGGFVHHRKALGAGLNRRIIAAWAVAMAGDRPPIVVVMDIDEVNAIRDNSPSFKFDPNSPWKAANAYPGMAGKTAKRRLSRSLPLSAYQIAAAIDQAHEEQGRHAYADYRGAVVIDGEARHLAGEPQPGNGPSAAQLAHQPFRISGRTRVFDLPNIGTWTAEVIRRVETLRPELVREFSELNRENLEGLRERYPEEVMQAEAAIERRLADAGPPPEISMASSAPEMPADAGEHNSATPVAAGVPSPASAAGAGGDTAEKKPDRTIKPPERGGRPDWLAFKTLLVIELRKPHDGGSLPMLLGDNEANIGHAKAAIEPRETADLEREIREAWDRVQS